MKNFLVLLIVLNIITVSIIMFEPTIPILYINAYKMIAFIIYGYAIVLGITNLKTKPKVNQIVIFAPTHFNPEVCRKCGYKLCICHLYPPPEKPKSSVLTIIDKNNANA